MSDQTTKGDSGRPCVPAEVPPLMTVQQVCEVLGLSEASVYRMMDAGELPYLRLTPRTRRVKRGDVLALIERKTVARA